MKKLIRIRNEEGGWEGSGPEPGEGAVVDHAPFHVVWHLPVLAGPAKRHPRRQLTHIKTQGSSYGVQSLKGVGIFGVSGTGQQYGQKRGVGVERSGRGTSIPSNMAHTRKNLPGIHAPINPANLAAQRYEAGPGAFCRSSWGSVCR